QTDSAAITLAADAGPRTPHSFPTRRSSDLWAHFAPLEALTIPQAARLVRHARVKNGDRVLDVGCGTGVVAITAAGLGAHATGLEDRKSTRLNSSHQIISYAVFGLKNKKQAI